MKRGVNMRKNIDFWNMASVKISEKNELKRIKDKLTLKNIMVRKRQNNIKINEQYRHILDKANIPLIY